ncbi:MAG: MFS transporter [Planctomycetaceae bacterium]
MPDDDRPAPPPPAAGRPWGTRRDLRVSIADAAAYSLMVGCGETYIPAFALALGLGPVAAGLAAAVPVIAGAVLQLAAPLGPARMGTNRGWVIVCTTVQAASFAPLVWWALRGRAGLAELLVAASVYWGAGMAGAPAWTAWIATLVPARIRTSYFANRNRLGQFGVFVGFVAGGLALESAERHGTPLAGFAAVFVAAAACRLASTALLVACGEPQPPGRAAVAVGAARRVPATLRGMASRPSGRLVAFICCFMFGAHFAGPYFTPYMLEELGFSYHAYLLVFGTSFLTKALVLPMLGRLASRTGPLGLLGLATLAIAPLSLLWLPSAAVGWLVVVQVIAGACWAAYELAVAILLLDAIGDEERTAVVTVYNLGLAVATVAGAGCGGLLLRSLGEDRAAYATVFAVSCVLRAAALPLLRLVQPRS